MQKSKINLKSISTTCWLAALILGLNLSASAQPTEALRGALPIPGTSQTSEYLTLNQHGNVLYNNGTALRWEENGNLVLYFYGQEELWSSNTGGKGNMLVFQNSDGKLVIKNQTGNIIWSAPGTSGKTLKVLEDRNMVLFNGNNQQIWETNTTLPQLNGSSRTTVVFSGEKAQDFMIPSNTTAKYLYLHAEGADGGKREVKELWGTTRFTVNGGAGATVKGNFEIGTGTNMIPPGSILRFIVGAKGPTRTGQTTAGCAGGAGTAVFVKKPNIRDWHLLMVAGGGGGAYSDCCTDKHPGKQAEISESGSSGGGSNGTSGGSNGDAGEACVSIGGNPGGGAFGSTRTSPDPAWPNGNNDPSSLPTGSQRMQSGGAIQHEASPWGFGGGGQEATSGAGGGGYSGGGTNGAYQSGGGGGSYFNDAMGSHKIMTANGSTSDTGHGYAKYELTNQPVILNVISLEQHPDKCIHTRDGWMGEGAWLELWDCMGTTAQQWVLEDDQIKPLNKTERCVTIKNADYTNGTQLLLWNCYGDEHQQWVYDGVKRLIRSKKNLNKCFALSSNSTGNGTLIQLMQCNTGETQQWDLNGATTSPTDDRVQTIRPAYDTNKCFHTKGGSTANGANVELWDCLGTEAQEWYFSSTYIKFNSDHDKCLTLPVGEYTNGANIFLEDCNGGYRQQWVYDGFNKSIRSVRTPDKCIHIKEGSSANGANVELWNCMGTVAQQFEIN
ncbi:MAG: ricin-type beta-trefoil lectin domain protein [Phaeodactylibacter sp.]|nr:ricin-type beta-trefoil lectin domain protein [Phaeodactylibacter sp.]